MYRTELGIDTLSYYCGLTYKQKDGIMKQMKALPNFQTEYQDYWETTCVYRSDCFAQQGVKLVVSQIKGSRWGLLVIVHPTLVLGTQDRNALYQPRKKKEYKFVVKQVDHLLKKVKIPCSIDDRKLYRGDVTGNLTFEDTDITEEDAC